MCSNFIVTSLVKFLKDIEKSMVDRYGDFFYKTCTSKHQLHEASVKNESYDFFLYRQDDMKTPKISVDNIVSYRSNGQLPPVLLLQMDKCAGNNKNTMFLHFHPF